MTPTPAFFISFYTLRDLFDNLIQSLGFGASFGSVSYTHLTLPTKA